jgi:colanic acid/amylovoran biosynthesis glycosyltransferase
MIEYMTTNGIGNAWVANELRIVERERIPFRLHALFRPDSTFFLSDEIEELNRTTNYIYPIKPLRVFISFIAAPILFGSRYWTALWNVFVGERESLWRRAKSGWHFVVACDWARSLRNAEVTLIHSQWIHSSGTVAMYAAWLLDKPFSFTGHAADLFPGRVALADKIRRADNIICISEFHRAFYLEHGARPEQLRLAYCGIDTTQFAPATEPREDDSIFHILASGRLVEKKGFRFVIDACKVLLDRGLPVRCTIAGSGPLQDELVEQIRALNLEDRVTVTGEPMMQEQIPELMHSADVYCLPCVWASDTDVDGLPQMLMEAMACGLPVISTRLVGIPDLVIHESTGLLAEPEDASGLADCLQRLYDEPKLAGRLAERGREHVTKQFDLRDCLNPLTDYYRAALEAE